jgi:Na+/H+ antiporter NhaC
MQYGWWSLVPPAVAIILAIVSRRVVLSLLAGITVGTVILKDWSADWNPISVIEELTEAHLWPSLANEDHLRVFAFTSLMGAMIGVIQRCGGMNGVVNSLAPLARSRRGGQILTWLLGLIIFIDDYANTLLLGHTMRPLADRLRISREKLAYLVDSTAAPVSGLALISTWVAGEIGYIEEGFKSLDLGSAAVVDGFGVFVATIPYRFYVLFALLLVPLVGLLGRDFGPMLQAERQATRSHAGRSTKEAAPQQHAHHRWYNAVLPVLVTIIVTVWLLVVTGSREAEIPLSGSLSWQTLVNVFGSGDSYLSLVYGSLAGLFSAALLAWTQRILTGAEIREAAFEGARLVIPALTILWLAWALSGLTGSDHLGTGEYLGSLLERAIDVRWMPTMVFILSSLVAFSTGTSWGTMGILMPIVVGATYQMLGTQTGSADPEHVLMVASIGSVLAGAIFGDHCSPISDTTVLSSQASGCDHVSHVWTQIPYALLAATVSVVLGTIPVGFGLPVWPLLGIGSVLLVVALLVVGRRA